MTYEEKLNYGALLSDESTPPVIPDVDYDTPVETGGAENIGDQVR